MYIVIIRKLSFLLLQGTMREGIQLNLSQLNSVFTEGQMSEACIKKLNFVVDGEFLPYSTFEI